MQMQRWSTGYRASPPAQPSEYEPDHDGGKRDHGPVPQTVNWSTRQRLMRVRIDLHAYTGLTTANRSGRSDCPQLPMPRLGRTESAHSGRAPSGGSLSLCCHSGCRRASPWALVQTRAAVGNGRSPTSALGLASRSVAGPNGCAQLYRRWR